jgi:hypothetical protein
MKVARELTEPVQEQVGQVLYDQRGIANLSSVSPLVVACGGAIWTGPLINRVSVIVYDRNPVADVVCTLVLVDRFGASFSTSSASSSGSQADFQELRFAPGVRTDTMSLQCTIPAATASGVSHLTTYRVLSTP